MLKLSHSERQGMSQGGDRPCLILFITISTDRKRMEELLCVKTKLKVLFLTGLVQL